MLVLRGHCVSNSLARGAAVFWRQIEGVAGNASTAVAAPFQKVYEAFLKDDWTVKKALGKKPIHVNWNQTYVEEWLIFVFWSGMVRI